MSLAEMIRLVRTAREAGSPVGVILGDHGSTGTGMNWSHVCAAELMRLGWVERGVDLHPKRPLVTACALIDVLPPLQKEPIAAGGPALYTFSQDRLCEFNPGGTWILAGLSSIPAALPETTYWIRQFDGPAPAGALVIDGFDAESFFAGLLEAFDKFPPQSVLSPTSSRPQCISSKGRTPAQQMSGMLYAHTGQASSAGSGLHQALLESYPQSTPVSDPDAWVQKIERAIDLQSRLSGQDYGFSFAPLIAGLADGRIPRIADYYLERAERLYRTNIGTQHGDYMLAQIASALCKRAKLHSGEAADQMYAEADQLMARAKSGTKAGEVSQLKNWGEMLADWAQIKRNEAEAAVLFDGALEKLEKALTIPIEKFWAKNGDDVKIRAAYVYLVGRRARKVGAAMPERYFEAARIHCQKLIESNESWRGYYALGILDIYQTRVESVEHLRRAMELAPEQKAALLSDWGVALFGAELLNEAYARFGEAAALDPAGFIPHVNMSAIRVRQAQQGAPVIEEAVRHAEMAEALKPGRGAYNLACAAGLRGDREEIEKWLWRSGELGYLGDRDTVVGDLDFRAVVSEPWFVELLDRLYPE